MADSETFSDSEAVAEPVRVTVGVPNSDCISECVAICVAICNSVGVPVTVTVTDSAELRAERGAGSRSAVGNGRHFRGSRRNSGHERRHHTRDRKSRCESGFLGGRL